MKRASTTYFSAEDQFIGSAPDQEVAIEPPVIAPAQPAGILTGGKKRGGVKWRDENPSEDAPAERIKHFDFLDAPEKIRSEEEYGGNDFSVPDDTREHPWFNSQSAMMNHRKKDNVRRRGADLQEMVMSLPRAEANANTYAQDIGTDEELSRPKVEATEAENAEFMADEDRARRRQNRALGVRSYGLDQRGDVVRRANAGRQGAAGGFFSNMMRKVGRLLGAGQSRDRTFDAVPHRGWFRRLRDRFSRV
jgi:hypothetical protein